VTRRWEQYDAANALAAAVIRADPDGHGGPESLVVRWMGLWTRRHEPDSCAPEGPPRRFEGSGYGISRSDGAESTGGA